MLLKKVCNTWNCPKWQFSIHLKNRFLPELAILNFISESDSAYSITLWPNEPWIFRKFLWRSIEGSMLAIRKLVFLGHVCDIATLKREGLNKLSKSRYWELHGYIPKQPRVPLLLLPMIPYKCCYQVGQKSEKLEKIGYHLWVQKIFSKSGYIIYPL